MLRSVPCILEVPCCGSVHVASLQTLGGRPRHFAVLPTTLLADVTELIRLAYRKPKFKVKLLCLRTQELSTEGHHQPFASLDIYFNVIFEWISRCEPGDYLALADGSINGDWPSVSSDSAVAGAYQTPYMTTTWGPLALHLTEAISACLISGAPPCWTNSVVKLRSASERTLTRGIVKSIAKLVQAGETLGFRTAAGSLRLFLRHHNLMPAKRRYIRKAPPLKNKNMSKSLAQLRRQH